MRLTHWPFPNRRLAVIVAAQIIAFLLYLPFAPVR
jgi:hypothetical protein